MSKYATDSFNVDHTTMSAPNIRRASQYSMDGVLVSKLDLRFCKPNRNILSRSAMHTIEHLFAEVAHSFFPNIIDFSPMGCGTGFYLTFFGDFEPMEHMVPAIFERCLELTEIPAVNPVQCGNYKLHDMPRAKAIISDFINNLPRR